MWKALILVGLIFSVRAANLKPKVEDYCKQGSDHTVCYYNCERSSWCGTTKDGFKTLTDPDREMILEKHNELRNEVAEGKWESKSLPKAADMQVLSYDKEMEFLAGCWTKQCTWAHDTNRNRADGTKCGQNMNLHQESPYKMDKAFWHEGLQAMFEEYKLLKPEYVNNFYTPGKFMSQKGTGHLTQLVWGKTKFVGCAQIHYIAKSLDNYFWVCNYAPGGNVQKGMMYTKGDPACAEKNDKYASLCGKIRPMSEDTFVGPIKLDDAQAIKPNVLLMFIVLVYILNII